MARLSPALAGDQLLHLLVRLAAADLRVHLDQGEVGDGDAERLAQLADHDLGDQRLGALPRAGELHHVGAQVVGLHQPGQRPALPQRGQVRRGGDPGQHGRRLVVGAACGPRV